MKPTDAFFDGARYAVFGARARGRAHGPVLIAALRKAGKQAAAIDAPGAAVKGAEAHASLAAAGPVDGAVILPPAPWNAESAEFTTEAVRQCREAGVTRVWIYTAGDPAPAVAVAESEGIDPVSGRCPCLHIVGGGFPHGLHRWMLKVARQL